jgi:probable rRNA maturation factor
VAAAALDETGAPSPASIGLIMSGDDELAVLNARHMGHDGPTDVLSFPLLEMTRGKVVADPAGARPPRQRLHLGDLIVSVERALEQAAEGRGGQTGDVAWAPVDELRLLVIHGVLHICGWDHAQPGEEAEMRALEGRIMSREAGR